MYSRSGGLLSSTHFKEIPMLILRRAVGQTIEIGDDITITVVSNIQENLVEIGVQAPSDLCILRGELTQGQKSNQLQRQKIIRKRNGRCPVCGGNYADYKQRAVNPCCNAVFLAERADHHTSKD